jgi:hypothetical protein
MKIYQLIGLSEGGERTLCVTELRGELLATQSLGRWGWAFKDLRVSEWEDGRRVRFVDLDGVDAL